VYVYVHLLCVYKLILDGIGRSVKAALDLQSTVQILLYCNRQIKIHFGLDLLFLKIQRPDQRQTTFLEMRANSVGLDR